MVPDYFALANVLFLKRWCFAAGTKLAVEGGFRAIEDIRPGDRVLSRDQWDESGEIVAKIVEEVFERYTAVLEVDVEGRTIRTTGEHPFKVRGKGWTPANRLQPGDRLVCADRTTVAVDEVFDTGEWELVYNLRVAEYHTYFVGDDEWGLRAWAHNAYAKQYYITEDSDSRHRGEYTLFNKANGHRVVSSKTGKSDWRDTFAKAKRYFQSQLAEKQGFPAAGKVYDNEPEADSGWSEVLAGFNSGHTDVLGVAKPDPMTFDMHLLNQAKYVAGETRPAHAHHIVMEKGTAAQRRNVRAAQQILRDSSIDLYFSKDNLIWAPNFSHHNDNYAKDTLSRLRVAANNGQIADELMAIGRDFKRGDWDV